MSQRSPGPHRSTCQGNLLAWVLFSLAMASVWSLPLASIVAAQDAAGSDAAAVTDQEPEVEVAAKVEVDPVNDDGKIADRLTEIFETTGWFEGIGVQVREGVAFIEGSADTEAHLKWAEQTAMNTTDVVAVVNQLELVKQPFWNFEPAKVALEDLLRDAVKLTPLLILALVIALVAFYLAKFATHWARQIAGHRIDSVLLAGVVGNVVGVLVFVVGVYLALRLSGLTRLAVTLLGGTGLVGLALGFAFRDIAENYLASILISLNHPFRVGDLIEVDGSKGFVRMVTTRGTVLHTLDGDQIQIPNSTVYKSKIQNFTATPLTRLSTSVGIGFDDSITEAQECILQMLEDHPAVIDDPPPLVLVETLGAATVNLRAFYWIDQIKYSKPKVGSAITRRIKETLMKAGISMPDEARELVFPDGVPVQMINAEPTDVTPSISANHSPRGEADRSGQDHDVSLAAAANDAANADDEDVSRSEGDLSNEQAEVLQVTAGDEVLQRQENLLGK